MHTQTHTLTVKTPGLHGHAEVSGLDLSTVHWDSWVLTHETGDYVRAPWTGRKRRSLVGCLIIGKETYWRCVDIKLILQQKNETELLRAAEHTHTEEFGFENVWIAYFYMTLGSLHFKDVRN